jgi:Taurine catabolism dioxygenase TauD, TfdA family
MKLKLEGHTFESSASDSYLPLERHDRSVWYGAELAARVDWIERFSEAEVGEVTRASYQLQEMCSKQADVAFAALTGSAVSLPTLGSRLRGMMEEVLWGRGFVVIKGLPVEGNQSARGNVDRGWTKREAAIAFLVIGAQLGALRMQNAAGHLLGHVRDLGKSSDDPNTRIYQTRERQTFHTDSCDVVGLMCLRTAKSGGLSSLVSSTMIFNEMRRRRPDLLKGLMEPIETDRRGETPAGGKPYFNIPVFNYHEGLLSAIYQRQYIESARRFPDVPPLTPQQVEALDLFDELANDPKLHLLMELEPGDIQLVHNHTILHDRTAFEDFPEPERKRHLLRLWLAPTNARPLPQVFAERFGSVTPGHRGGVNVPGAQPTIPFEE